MTTVLMGVSGSVSRHLKEALLAHLELSIVVTRIAKNISCISNKLIKYGKIRGLGKDWILEVCDILFYRSVTGLLGNDLGSVVNPSQTVQPVFSSLPEHLIEIYPDCQVVSHSSGRKVYGSGHSPPIAKCDRQRPCTAYVLEKQLIEYGCDFAVRVRGAKVAVRRVAKYVGCWQTKTSHGLVCAATSAALRKRTLTLFGRGHNVRDYFIVEGAWKIMVSANAHNRNMLGVLSTKSRLGRSEHEVIELSEDCINSSIKIAYISQRGFDSEYAFPNVQLAQSKVAFFSQDKLERIIDRIASRLERESE